MEYRVTYQQYQQGLEQGEFVGLKCNECGAVTFPPLGVCRKCSGTNLEQTQMSGMGIVKTFTVIRVPPEGMKAPYVVAMVKLDEGPYVTGNLVGIDPDKTDMDIIDKRVKLGSQVIDGNAGPENKQRVLTFELV